MIEKTNLTKVRYMSCLNNPNYTAFSNVTSSNFHDQKYVKKKSTKKKSKEEIYSSAECWCSKIFIRGQGGRNAKKNDTMT